MQNCPNQISGKCLASAALRRSTKSLGILFTRLRTWGEGGRGGGGSRATPTFSPTDGPLHQAIGRHFLNSFKGGHLGRCRDTFSSCDSLQSHGQSQEEESTEKRTMNLPGDEWGGMEGQIPQTGYLRAILNALIP